MISKTNNGKAVQLLIDVGTVSQTVRVGGTDPTLEGAMPAWIPSHGFLHHTT